VICTHVSNVFGYILPVEEIAALCRARGVPFVLDASQSAGLLPVRLAELGADFIGMPGHKALYGPQGTGLLLCARMPDTLLEGGSGSASRLPDMPPELPDHAEAGTQKRLRHLRPCRRAALCAAADPAAPACARNPP